MDWFCLCNWILVPERGKNLKERYSFEEENTEVLVLCDYNPRVPQSKGDGGSGGRERVGEKKHFRQDLNYLFILLIFCIW